MMRSASAPSRFVGVLGAMIGRLTGTVVECTPNALVLDVGGVGYALQIPLSTFYAVRGHDAAPVSTLHVHTHVREDSLLLFGFATREERSAFEHLISPQKNRIAPRLTCSQYYCSCPLRRCGHSNQSLQRTTQSTLPLRADTQSGGPLNCGR